MVNIRNPKHWDFPHHGGTVCVPVIEDIGQIKVGDTVDVPSLSPSAVFVHIHDGDRYRGRYDIERGGVVRVTD